MRALATTAISLGILVSAAFAQKEPGNPPSTKETKTKTTKTDQSLPNDGRVRTYKGYLVPATCGDTDANSGSAVKKGKPAKNDPNCTLSGNVNAYALKLKNGRVFAFDSVGNDRTKLAIENHKKWEKKASSGKPIAVVVDGVPNEGKLTVMGVQPPPKR